MPTRRDLHISLVAWLGLASVTLLTPGLLFGSEPGTTGIAVNQLYSEQQPTKRGAFMVRRVEPSSAAADAGIQPGDLILATNGQPVFNIDAREMTERLAGPAGSSIELSVVPADGKVKKIALTRRPYSPHLNPQTDAFRYSVPGNWQMDLRYHFPLPWSPALALKGFEDLYFAPGFDDPASPEYHSYFFFWWLDGKQQITAESLETDMVTYFSGLAEQRGQNNRFKPDLSKIGAQYARSAVGRSNLGDQPATTFSGMVSLFDRRGEAISLRSEVTTAYCADGHTTVVFAMAKEPRPSLLWSQLDAIRDSFRCQK
jgi:hypothetical protein